MFIYLLSLLKVCLKRNIFNLFEQLIIDLQEFKLCVMLVSLIDHKGLNNFSIS